MEVKKIDATVAGDILNRLMATAQEGEWGSVTINITDGPNEAPVIFAAILPGTTKENALRIQEAFIKSAESMNKG